MLGRFRNALYSAMGSPEGGEVSAPNSVAEIRSKIDTAVNGHGGSGTGQKKVKYAYQRPIFLQLFTGKRLSLKASGWPLTYNELANCRRRDPSDCRPYGEADHGPQRFEHFTVAVRLR